MSTLYWIGDTLRDQLELVPLRAARWMILAVYLALMFWIVQLPVARTTPAGRVSRWYEDLRIWAWLALIFQIVIYSVF